MPQKYKTEKWSDWHKWEGSVLLDPFDKYGHICLSSKLMKVYIGENITKDEYLGLNLKMNPMFQDWIVRTVGIFHLYACHNDGNLGKLAMN